MGSNIAHPPGFFFIILNIVQYLYVNLTIPSILGSHPPYPHLPHPNPASNQPPPPNQTSHPPTNPPTLRRILPAIFFWHFYNNFNFWFTSTLTPSLRSVPRTPPPPFFLSCFLFCIFTITSILRSHPP